MHDIGASLRARCVPFAHTRYQGFVAAQLARKLGMSNVAMVVGNAAYGQGKLGRGCAMRTSQLPFEPTATQQISRIA